MCPSCAGDARKTIVGSGNWRLWRCRSCDLAFQFPLPDVAELDTLYGAQYFASNYVGIEETQRRFFASQIAKLDRWVRPGVAVDVGCGTGLFLDELGADWSRIGIDFSQEAVKLADLRGGIYARICGLDQVDIPDSSCRLITFWDALEHFPSPSEPLTTAKRLTSADGVLVVKVPNMRSYLYGLAGASRLVGGGRHPFYPDAHLLHFNRRSLTHSLERAGFEVLEMYGATDPHPARLGRLSAKALGKYLFKLTSRNPVLRDSLVAIARPADDC